MRVHFLAALLHLFSAGLVLSSTALAGYTVVDVGALSGPRGQAYGINNRGDVVGYGTVYTPAAREHAIYFDGQTLTTRDLGLLSGANAGNAYAYDVNDFGQVVGSSTGAFAGTHAFITGPNGGAMVDLGTLGGSTSQSLGINNSGQVVGLSYVPGDRVAHAFLFSNGSMIDLGTLGGTDSRATDINESGEIAGFSVLQNQGVAHAFVYRNEAMIDLGTLGGLVSIAEAINDFGQVVGRSELLGTNAYHAFLSSGGAMVDLGTLGGTNSNANGINNQGQIVGFAYTAQNDAHGFLYTSGQMLDLNSLLPSGSPWTIVEATGINERGQISAVGYRPDYEHGTIRALRLDPIIAVPVPEPGTFSLLGIGVLVTGLCCGHRRPHAIVR